MDLLLPFVTARTLLIGKPQSKIHTLTQYWNASVHVHRCTESQIMIPKGWQKISKAWHGIQKAWNHDLKSVAWQKLKVKPTEIKPKSKTK